MKGSSIAAFVFASIILCFQLGHFSYYKFFDPHQSVLNDYLDLQIKEAENLDVLIAEYDKARRGVKIYEEENPDRNMLTQFQRQSIEPYKTKIRLELAIDTWEKKTREYERVWYQWTAGLVLFIVGMVLFSLHRRWMPLSLPIAGHALMIWWSSPTRMIVGALSEHERLLNAKLLLTIITFIMLIGAWLFSERAQKRNGGDLV